MKVAMHPGEYLKETYLKPLGISINELAAAINVSPATVSRLTSGKSKLSTEMAVRLSKCFGNSPQQWAKLQYEHDILWECSAKMGEFKKIKRLYGNA